MRWVLLMAAIGSEVSATLMLRQSDGFSRLLPSLLVIAGYGCAFFCLAQVLKAGVKVGVAYAIWSAIGVAAIAILGRVLFGESLPKPAVAGIGLIIAGVLLVETATSGEH